MTAAFGIYARSFFLVAVSATTLCSAQDITIPLESGSLVIQKPRLYSKGKDAFLSFLLENKTSSSWSNIDLEFKIGGFCADQPLQWSHVVHVGYLPTGKSPDAGQDTVAQIPGSEMDCTGAIIKAKLNFATSCANPLCLGNGGRRIEGLPNQPLSIEKEFQAIQERRVVEVEERKQRRAALDELVRQNIAAEVEREHRQVAAEAERARQEAAAETERQTKLAAERKRSQEEYANREAEKDAKAAVERARIRAACGLVYNSTANKKMGDLTVKEDQQVRACQVLGLYPPR